MFLHRMARHRKVVYNSMFLYRLVAPWSNGESILWGEKPFPYHNRLNIRLGSGKLKLLFYFTLGNIHVLRKQVFGIFDPLPPPLSSIVSIWHDPPLVLRKIFETPPNKKKGCVSIHSYRYKGKSGSTQILKLLFPTS